MLRAQFQTFWREWGKDLLIACLAAAIIKAGVAEARVVPSPSMVPTILPGDRLLVEKVTYHFHDPARGDIVVFHPPFQSPGDYIKRVVALPGQQVEIKNGMLHLDGQPQTEPYINERPSYTYGPVTVPAGKVLVLGDNRNASYDGHAWGFLDAAEIKGRAIARFWPLSRVSAIR